MTALVWFSPWWWWCCCWWMATATAVHSSSLWEKSCPSVCSCTVEPWPYIQLDAKVMRCENRSLDAPPRNLTSETEVLILQQNQLGGATDFNLYDFRYLQSLRFLDLSANRIRILHTHSITFPQVRYLNLSHNDIHTIQTEVLNDFPALEHLNLESNFISSLTIAAFSLPQLQYLNLRRNKIFTLKPHFYFNSPQLSTLVLSHNFLTRLPDSIFFRAPRLDKLDLSYNRLSKIEDLAFDGLRSVSELNLEGNVLRRVPSAALRTIVALGHLILNRNPLRQLDQSSFSGVSASHVTLCHCDELSVVHEMTFVDMVSLTTLELCSNRVLTSIAPRTFVGLPRLRLLDLQNNNLNVLEESVRADRSSLGDADDVSGYYDSSAPSTGRSVGGTEDSGGSSRVASPVTTAAIATDTMVAPPGGGPLTLRVSGNPFICDCNLKWVQDILTRQYGRNVTVAEGGNNAVKCLDRSRDVLVSVLEMDDLPSHCSPFVLPLFHPVVKETLASDVSFLCRGVGIPTPQVYWILPDGRHLANDLCEDRACVAANTLTIKYLHVQDSGVYECRAENTMGEFKRSVHLEVESVNVLLFALTVTSTFVTLAWNASGVPPNEYLLQYNPSDLTLAGPPTPSSYVSEDGGVGGGSPYDRQTNCKVIEMGTKVHSYTVSELTPGETYTFWLCIKRADYAIRVSTVQVTTKEEGFLLMLGIRRNYVSVILISAAAGIVALGCATLCCVKLCRWARQEHSEMVASDSGSGRCFVKSESCNSEVAFMTYINVAEDTILVENEDESPQ